MRLVREHLLQSSSHLTELRTASLYAAFDSVLTWTRALHNWPSMPLIFGKQWRHFIPSGGTVLGIHPAVYDSTRTPRMVFFSNPQEALEGVFTVIVTWPQAGATEARSTAHPHMQSQYIPPTHTFCFTQAVSPSVGTRYTFLFPRRTSSIQTRAGGWPSVAFALVEGTRSIQVMTPLKRGINKVTFQKETTFP